MLFGFDSCLLFDVCRLLSCSLSCVACCRLVLLSAVCCLLIGLSLFVVCCVLV